MKAGEARVLQFLQITNQFVIPIYQRPYSWTLRQCLQLWDDICRVATDDSLYDHFIGSIVYVKGNAPMTMVPQVLVIDGQQRLTTISLLLATLAKSGSLEAVPSNVTSEQIRGFYLFNSHVTNDLRYKLLLTQADRDTLIRIVDGNPLPDKPSARVVENYRFFERAIATSELDTDTIFKGISKLTIVDISLDRDHDNPQLIVESLNSTGLDLSQADLIRNYVLMGMVPDEQSEVYTALWYPMEQRFATHEEESHFDRFVRDYLTVATGRIPNVGEVYTGFKEFVRIKRPTPIRKIVEDLYRYSEC